MSSSEEVRKMSQTQVPPVPQRPAEPEMPERVRIEYRPSGAVLIEFHYRGRHKVLVPACEAQTRGAIRKWLEKHFPDPKVDPSCNKPLCTGIRKIVFERFPPEEEEEDDDLNGGVGPVPCSIII
jgi:hypothetical protein